MFFCLIWAPILYTVVQVNYSSHDLVSEIAHYQSDIDFVLIQDTMSIEENEDDRCESFVFLSNTGDLCAGGNTGPCLVEHTISWYRQNPVLIFNTNLPPPLSV
jgi:hypothetical protein